MTFGASRVLVLLGDFKLNGFEFFLKHLSMTFRFLNSNHIAKFNIRNNFFKSLHLLTKRDSATLL
jgi:hypothetical protein